MSRHKHDQITPYRGKLLKCTSFFIHFFISEETDECFSVIYSIFVKFGYHKITKTINFWCALFHSIFYILQVYYLIVKFNQSLLMKHLFVMTMFLYVGIYQIPALNKQFLFPVRR
jgi:hypothetical protein